MSTQAIRGHPARGYHRRKSLDLDLNSMPPTENRDQGQTSQFGLQEAQVNRQPSVQPAMIDIEAIDDDVIESSARAFAEVCFSSVFTLMFDTYNSSIHIVYLFY